MRADRQNGGRPGECLRSRADGAQSDESGSGASHCVCPLLLAALLLAGTLAGCSSWYPGQRPGPFTCTDTSPARVACVASPASSDPRIIRCLWFGERGAEQAGSCESISTAGFDCWDRCDPEGHRWHASERPAGAVEGDR